MAKEIKTIGVLTSGGDAPGMNAAIRAVVRTALNKGLKVKGIQKGYNGLLNDEIIDMDKRSVADIIQRGGTVLYTARCMEFMTEEGQKKGAEVCRKHGIDGIVVIGGDGSFRGAQKLAAQGINTIGIPGTIDLDIACTDYTIGFDTAVNTAMEAIDKIRDTSTSHERCSIIEVMGRNAGWLTAAAALSRSDDCEGVDMIYLPEKVFDIADFMEQVKKRSATGKSLVIAVSEGIKVADGRYVFELADHVEFVDAFGHKQLAGSAKFLADKIGSELGIKTRALEFSTLQRCAAHMTSRTDITEAFQVGGAAVKAAFEGETGKVVVLKRVSDDPYICITETHDVHKIANIEKKVPLEWITDDAYVTDDLIHYIRPLIQAELSPIMVDGLPRHLRLGDE